MKRLIPLALVFLTVSSFAANVRIPSLELITRGSLQGSSFALDTRALMDLEFEGGSKFGGTVRFGFDSEDLDASIQLPEQYDAAAIEAAINRSLQFQLASVTVRDMLGLPLDLTYFSGQLEQFTSGSTFPAVFGSVPFATSYRGYVYFPEGTRYDGVYDVAGTGLRLATSETISSWSLQLYGYQDQYLGTASYSSDLRFLLNTELLKLDAFGGASFPGGPYGSYRGGVMLYYNTGLAGQFFAQIGVPRWTPGVDEDLNIEHFYFLFEPRVLVGITNLSLTLFWHPLYYQQQETGETGSLDINLRISIGDPFVQLVTGGAEVVALLQPNASQQFLVRAAPFLSVNSDGVIWDLKVNFNAFPFSLGNLFEAFVGIRTQL